MNKVVVIAYDFPPVATAAAHRAVQLVRHLPRAGWSPLVVTPALPHSWAYDPAAAGRLPEDVEVIRTGTIEPSRIARRVAGHRLDGAGVVARTARRAREWLMVPDAHMGWIPAAVAAGSRAADGAEVVLSTSPPASAHIAAYVLSRMRGLAWVADFGDPWSVPGFVQWQGRLRPRVDDALERRVLGRADRVVATTHRLAAHLAGRGAGDRTAVVANGFDPAAFPTGARADHARFTIVHAGSFYGPRSPKPLLEAAAAALAADPGLHRHLRIRFLGAEDRANASRLEQAAVRMGLTDVVERTGWVPRAEALAAMCSASVLALVTDPDEGGRDLIPLKLFEYLGAGRPILALAPPEGEAARLARTAGGEVADPGDVSTAAVALRRLYRAWLAGDERPPPDPSLLEAYHWGHLAGELARVLDDVVKGRRRACAA